MSPLAFLPSTSFGPRAVSHTSRCAQRKPRACVGSPPPPSPTPSAPFNEQPDAPAWSGNTAVSRLVNFIIHFPPISVLLRYGARQVLISTAERSGIDWRGDVAQLNTALPPRSPKRQRALDAVVDSQLEYPSYYTKPFHAYPEGNLGWLPAFEARPATLSMAKRVFSDLSPQLAADRLRAPFFESIKNNTTKEWLMKPEFNVIDAGCGVGLSTRDLTSRIVAARGPSLPPPRVKAVDASPYFLAVANRLQAEHDQADSAAAPVEYIHALAEKTPFESNQFDLWSMQLVAHELPDVATTDIAREAFRVLRRGGVFAIMDQDPRSAVVRNLPPAVATLLKSTEPYTDQYYFLDIAQLLNNVGFVQVTSECTTPRHRCILAIKP
eukprot:TRINITY_DN1452_c0_g4_i1.p1 TRINITY_DN1452_c0_g4~~TRINITY_DN1452_c0_g4_i1.p1  ORF type:complete len:381 (-),score=50.48 TRINITY_DN1452_c0_g4_i1:623-1765(-)